MTRLESSYTILVVEDDRHTQELISFTLAEAGFDVLTASNGEEGLLLLETHQVDLILCDIMLPRMDGFALREHILDDPVLREIAFLFITARTMPEDVIRGLRMGADEYITKPFDPQVLVARVQAVLARRESYAKAASLDPLTQLLNRNALERAVTRELERVTRYRGVGTLAFVDVDGFKKINDEHGHAVGDQILVNLAAVFGQCMRRIDIAGRYGGEEFVLYFPETSEAVATNVLMRMEERFHEVTEAQQQFPVTFSAGIAEAPRDGESFVCLCSRADTAMYHAKRWGKSRIVTWAEEMKEMGA